MRANPAESLAMSNAYDLPESRAMSNAKSLP